MPGLLPGFIVPPLLMRTLPMEPVPASVPPLLTVVAVLVLLPLKNKVPALIVVAPE